MFLPTNHSRQPHQTQDRYKKQYYSRKFMKKPFSLFSAPLVGNQAGQADPEDIREDSDRYDGNKDNPFFQIRRILKININRSQGQQRHNGPKPTAGIRDKKLMPAHLQYDPI